MITSGVGVVEVFVFLSLLFTESLGLGNLRENALNVCVPQTEIRRFIYNLKKLHPI